MTTIDIFVVDKLMAQVFESSRHLASVTGMNTVIFGRGDKEYFGVIFVCVYIVIRRYRFKKCTLDRVIRMAVFTNP